MLHDQNQSNPLPEITITSLPALYRDHPQCVELTPKLLAIKDLLNANSHLPGYRVSGVEAIKGIKQRVRADTRKAIKA